jgi:hypothetical protein
MHEILKAGGSLPRRGKRNLGCVGSVISHGKVLASGDALRLDGGVGLVLVLARSIALAANILFGLFTAAGVLLVSAWHLSAKDPNGKRVQHTRRAAQRWSPRRR